MEESSKHCLNCGAILEGPFCAQCGQSAKVGRLTLKGALVDAFRSIFNWEKGVGYTTKRFVLSPGSAMKDYAAGKRVVFMAPIRFLLLWLFIVYTPMVMLINYGGYGDVIEVAKAEDWIASYEKQYSDATPEELAEGREFAQKMAPNFNKAFYYTSFAAPAFFNVISIPFFALLTWLLFRQRGANFAEHVTAATYATAMLALFMGVVMLLLLLTGGMGRFGPAILLAYIPMIAYEAWLYKRWLGGSWRGAILKIGLANLVLSMLSGFILFSFTMILTIRQVIRERAASEAMEWLGHYWPTVTLV